MYRFIASDLLVSGFQNNLDINENASISSTTIIGLALVRAFKENLSLIDSLRVMGNLYPLAGYSDDFIRKTLENHGLETVAVYHADTFLPPQEDSQRLVYVARHAGKKKE